MTFSYYQRYCADAHEQVWAELIALGDQVRAEPLYSDAMAVARETMRRARVNIETIVERLTSIGFAFGESERVFIPAAPDAEKLIAQVEGEFGPFSLSVRAWFETVETVHLGYEKLYWWQCPQDDRFRNIQLLSIMSLREALEDEEKGTYLDDKSGKICLCLPTGMAASNCDPLNFNLPEPGADQWFYDDGEGDRFFVRYLRELFQMHHLQSVDPTLIPFLKEGLLEI